MHTAGLLPTFWIFDIPARLRISLGICDSGRDMDKTTRVEERCMDAQELYERMKKVQEPKGYYFNKDMERTFELLDALLLNKDRYGYMGCPCRLLSGDRKKDRDIICPCVYSVPDIAEYGSCYCNLYVSKAWNEDQIAHDYVPERRPPEKYDF
jgi:ferredoxin-thioredoxin reductase catalytic subunit